ncbi:MAG: hypothetical protein IBJ11_06720, partial [Phycisphaerales bacterium]|nr:hypothetical protein [Phycisphaerales bacterium]
MGEVRVRKLDVGDIFELKERAKRERTSVEAILRRVIAEEARRPRRELLAMVEEHQQQIRDTSGELPDSTPLIREERAAS